MLQVHVDASELSGFSVAAPEVIQHYKYKNMKAALANIPAGKDIGGSVSTKVRVESPGQQAVHCGFGFADAGCSEWSGKCKCTNWCCRSASTWSQLVRVACTFCTVDEASVQPVRTDAACTHGCSLCA